jgi:major membrane immunogen (membrane-anchored lipoprotein)
LENDKITNVDFNYKNSITGELITDDDVHAKLMYEATNITPATASKKLETSLLKAQDVTKVDTITGATTTTSDFKTLSTAALENAKKGTPTLDVIPYSK